MAVGSLAGGRPINYSKWDNFQASSSDEDEEHTRARSNTEIDLEQTQRIQVIEEEVATNKAQLATLRQQRKDVDEALGHQNTSSRSPKSQWMLIGGASFAKVPSHHVRESLSNGARIWALTSLAGFV
jgi:hypothetical protein